MSDSHLISEFVTLKSKNLHFLFNPLFTVLNIPRTPLKNGSPFFTSQLPSTCWEHWSTPCLAKERCSPGPSEHPPAMENEAVSVKAADQKSVMFQCWQFGWCQTPNTSGEPGLFLQVENICCTGTGGCTNISKHFFKALEQKGSIQSCKLNLMQQWHKQCSTTNPFVFSAVLNQFEGDPHVLVH